MTSCLTYSTVCTVIYLNHSKNFHTLRKRCELTVLHVCNIELCVLASWYPADICKVFTNSNANIQQG